VGGGDYTLSGFCQGNGKFFVNCQGTITMQRGPGYVWGANTDGIRVGNGGNGVYGDSLLAQNGAPGGGGGGAGDVAGGSNNALGGYGGGGFVFLYFLNVNGFELPTSYAMILASNAAYPVPAGATRVILYVGGAGGAGGSGIGTTGNHAAGGGGGGGWANVYADLNGATALNIAIGAGGVPARSGVGTAGGNTVVSFGGVVVTARGGAPGTQALTTAAGGAGGTVTATGTVVMQTFYAGQAGATGNNSGGGGGSCGGTGTATGAAGGIAPDRMALAAALAKVGGNLYGGGTYLLAGTMMATHRYSFGPTIIRISAGATLHRNGFAIPNAIINNGGTVL
jgi:hypothetical protein